MKKINLLAITPILIASTGVGISFQNRAAEDIELSSAITSNTNFFFKNTYQIDSKVQISNIHNDCESIYSKNLICSVCHLNYKVSVNFFIHIFFNLFSYPKTTKSDSGCSRIADGML